MALSVLHNGPRCLIGGRRPLLQSLRAKLDVGTTERAREQRTAQRSLSQAFGHGATGPPRPTCEGLVTTRFSRYKKRVLFSGKISHSMLTFLDRHGEDLSALYESSEWPAELMRDPTYWLEAEKMETFLDFLVRQFGHTVAEGALAAEVGRSAVELRAWGALDSVLRLVHSPKDLFAQPERLLSYFISPAPPVGNLRRDKESVSFEVPLDSSEYPLAVEYLKAAFEALPTYVGRPAATVRWDGSEIEVRWTETQESLFGEREVASGGRSLNPELVRNVLVSLEESQRSLEDVKTRLALKNKEMDALRVQLRQAQSQSRAAAKDAGGGVAKQEKLDFSALVPGAGETTQSSTGAERASKAAAASLAPATVAGLSASVAGALDQAYRLGDYVGRAQQLVTLLVGQGRLTPQVQEAMRRVDWERVQASAPSAARTVTSVLQSLRAEMERAGAPALSEPATELVSTLSSGLGPDADEALDGQSDEQSLFTIQPDVRARLHPEGDLHV